MKTPLPLICAALASCLACYSSSGITIISSEQSVESHWTEEWVVVPENPDDLGPEDYYRTAGEGLVSEPHGWARGAVEVSAFEMRMEASAAANGWWEGLPGDVQVERAYLGTSAQATTRFTTFARQIDIDVSTFARFNYYDWEQDMRVTLLDLTSNNTLFDVDDLDVLGWSNTVLSFELPVDPSHEYELTMSGYINASDAKYAEMSLNVSISEVPDPVDTLPLFGLCLFGLVAARNALPHARKATV
jgi:hypothetical protein